MVPFTDLEKYISGQNKQIKISLNDLSFLFLQLYNHIAAHPDYISESEYQNLILIFNRYLVINEYRSNEVFWYDLLKKCDVINPPDERKRREVFGYYLEAKRKREDLQKELEKKEGKDNA